MSFKEITCCRLCGNRDLVEVLDLGQQALTRVFPVTPDQQATFEPLKLVKCHGDHTCHLLQLKHTFEQGEIMARTMDTGLV